MKKILHIGIILLGFLLCSTGCASLTKGGAASSGITPVSSTASHISPAASSIITVAESQNASSLPGRDNPSSRPGSALSAPSKPPNAGSQGKRQGIPILCYHDIMLPAQKGNVKNTLVMTTDDFDRQMSLLRKAGFTTVSLEQLREYLLNGGDMSRKFVLTFDDGYKTTCTLGAPILRKYGFRATIFIIARHVDEQDQPADLTNFVIQYANRTDMNESSDVFAYASHTYDMHIDLRTQKSHSKLEADLTKSRQALNETPYFAYPSGDYNASVIESLKEAGFQMAFTTRRRFAYQGDSLFEIPRIEIYSDMSDAAFERQLGLSQNRQ